MSSDRQHLVPYISPDHLDDQFPTIIYVDSRMVPELLNDGWRYAVDVYREKASIYEQTIQKLKDFQVKQSIGL